MNTLLTILAKIFNWAKAALTSKRGWTVIFGGLALCAKTFGWELSILDHVELLSDQLAIIFTALFAIFGSWTIDDKAKGKV